MIREPSLSFLVRCGVVFAILGSVAACSSDDNGSSGGPGQATTCDADTRKDIYTAGLTKAAGALTVKLIEATPGPMIKGSNAMTIELTDAAGKPVEAPQVTVVPTMPDHGHGSAVKPKVASLGGGKYTVSDIYLAMAGLWKLMVSVQMPDGGLQETSFNFCLDG